METFIALRNRNMYNVYMNFDLRHSRKTLYRTELNWTEWRNIKLKTKRNKNRKRNARLKVRVQHATTAEATLHIENQMSK